MRKITNKEDYDEFDRIHAEAMHYLERKDPEWGETWKTESIKWLTQQAEKCTTRIGLILSKEGPSTIEQDKKLMRKCIEKAVDCMNYCLFIIKRLEESGAIDVADCL